MASKPPDFTPIYEKFKEINGRQTIPADDISTLGKRLAIVCRVPQTQQRRPNRVKRLKNREYLVQSRERKVRNVYFEVLEKFPDIFLAFILTVSPKACRQFKVGDLFKQHTKQPISLCNEANLILWRIATEHGIEKSVRFQKLMSSLFKLPSPDAEGERSWSLALSDLAAIRTCLGDTICDAIQCSPKHNPKQVDIHHLKSTECIKTKVPYDADRDTIVYIDVGSALKLADMLFPAASERIASVLPKFSPVVFQPDGPETASGPAEQPSSRVSEMGTKPRNGTAMQFTNFDFSADFAYLTLRGACVSAIRLLFGTSVLEGIDESELRSWEKDQLLLDSTDCITMQVRRAQPEYGIIRLRIGFWAGVNLANELYTARSPAAIA
jgi:hypothetical protein